MLSKFDLMIDVNDLLVLVIEDKRLTTVSRNDLRDFEYNIIRNNCAFYCNIEFYQLLISMTVHTSCNQLKFNKLLQQKSGLKCQYTLLRNIIYLNIFQSFKLNKLL